MGLVERIKEKIEKVPLPLLSALICAAATIAGFAIVRVYPFGENTVITGDLYSQYMPFIVYLKRLLSGDGSLFYTAQAGLGEAMLPTFAYYLSSPLNLLVIFFPVSRLTEFFFLLIVIKIALSGASCSYALRRLTGAGYGICLAGSVMYALSMYVTAYSWNIMWMDIIALMPLVITSLNRMLEGKGSFPYILLTAFSFYLNFYLTYMVLIFVFMWFIMKCAEDRASFKTVIRAGGGLIIKTCLSFALVGWLMVPTVMHLALTPAGGDTYQGAGMNSHLLAEFSRMMFGMNPAVLNENLVNIYSGVLTLLSLILFFRLKDVSVRLKAGVFAFLVFLLLSFSLRDVMLFWNFFHYPVGLPYRNAFIFVFLNVLLFCVCMKHIESFNAGDIASAAAVVGIYVLWADATELEGLSFTSVYLTMALVIVYAMLLYMGTKRETVRYLLILCVLGEAVISCFGVRLNMLASGYLTVRSEYIEDEYHSLMIEAVKYVNSRDPGGFFRMQDSERFTNMDGMFYNFNSTAVFSSTHYRDTIETMRNLGMSTGANSQFETCFMPALGSLLGVRYYLTPSNMDEDRKDLVFFSSVLDGKGRVNIYRNDHALPPVFACSSETKDYESVQYDPVTCQNDLFSKMTGNPEKVLEPNVIKPEPTHPMQTYDVDTGVSFTIPEGNAKQTTGVLNCTVSKPGQVFIYIDCIDSESILVNSEGRTFMPDPGEAGFTDLGKLKKGAEIKVTVNSGAEGVTGNIYAVTMNEDVLFEDLLKLKKSGLHAMDFRDTSLSGVAEVPENSIMLTTFSYDRGWYVYVDGKRVPTYSVDSSLLAFDIPSGEHSIEMYFIPVGFRPGILLTFAAVLICVLAVYRKKLGKVKAEGTANLEKAEEIVPASPEETVVKPSAEETVVVKSAEETVVVKSAEKAEAGVVAGTGLITETEEE
ncbi:MAG: YfhO family protein [Lachnospiraceae bacterium]|nr:YfhO family protein [Lachnospiraceae bacterium]